MELKMFKHSFRFVKLRTSNYMNNVGLLPLCNFVLHDGKIFLKKRLQPLWFCPHVSLSDLRGIFQVWPVKYTPSWRLWQLPYILILLVNKL